jgi:2-polyprenyl-3-methyl-5-hydroxy-6-metoxy-1,4-benzoquinol methylase
LRRLAAAATNKATQKNTNFAIAMTPCIVCGSSRLRELKGGYENNYLCRCRNCGMVFSHRRPTTAELLRHYAGYDRTLAVSPLTLARYGQWLDDWQKYRQTGALLDVGCGMGHLLEVARDRGWRACGTEFSPEAVQTCQDKDLDVRLGSLAAARFDDATFDVVTWIEVVEHILNPLEDVEQIRRVLRPGGVVYVTTPNFAGLTRLILGPGTPFIEYPEHLSYYTPRTLRALFRRAGFVPLKIETTGFSPGALKRALAAPENVGTSEKTGAGGPDEALRASIESRPVLRAAKSVINFALNFLRIGDSLKGLFQKPL